MADALRSLRRGDKCIVTGGSGFVGRALCAALSAAGIGVVSLSRSNGFDITADDLPLDGVAHVFHAAGITGVRDAWSAAAEFHRVNAWGTLRIAEQCARSRCSMTYFSAYVYGQPTELPVAERHVIRPSNPYALSKWQGEVAAAWFAENHAMPLTVLRLFNAYGAGQSDEFLLPRLARQVLDPGATVVEVQDLAPRRDFVHVRDVAGAALRSVPAEGLRYFNVGSGASHSVEELLEAIQRLAGERKGVVDHRQVRRNEIPDVVADTAALRAATGWSPEVSLEQGLLELIAAERRCVR